MNGTGRNWKKKYMTIEMFEKFLSNDFYHLKRDVSSNKWLLRALLIALITASIMDRLYQ